MKPFFNTQMKAWNQEAAAGNLICFLKTNYINRTTLVVTSCSATTRRARRTSLRPLPIVICLCQPGYVTFDAR
jgi:hypothetical protein